MPVPASTSRIIQFDKYEVDVPAGHLLKQGVKVRLREQSLVVLVMLLEHPGEVVTREELRRRLWSEDTFVDFDNNLNTAIARLRVALSDPAEHPRFIETLPKRGYRFIGSLSKPAPASGQVPARRAKIAVLPFANLSGDPEQEYFSDAMTEEMITELAGLAPGQLGVIARTTAMHYKTSHKDVARIGRELAVDHVVEGSVRREDDRIGIIVQLIQVSDQTHLWTKRYETGLREFLGAVNAAAQAIALEIGIPPAAEKSRHGTLAGRGGIRKPTEDVAAYNLYLQGRYHLNKYTPEGIARAKQCFEEAIAQAPEFALAYNSLAEVYWNMGFLGFVPPKEAFSMGVWSALRAIEIDDKLAEAHSLLGSFRKELDYNWPEVHREMRRALELDPWSPFVRLRYGISGLMPLGRIQEAIAELERGLELDPLSPDLRFWHAYMLLLDRQYERGLQEVQLLIDHAPTYWLAHLTIGHLYGAMKMVDQATAAIRKATDLSGGAPNMLGWLGLALTQSGDTAEARTLLDRLHGIASQAYVPPTSFAWIHLGLGDIDSAFVWMDRAIDMRDTMIIPIKTYPFLDPLRSDPRFPALLRKMNLEA
jgi:TolB-like protein/Tfp pilus assembly protein PilF